MTPYDFQHLLWLTNELRERPTHELLSEYTYLSSRYAQWVAKQLQPNLDGE